MRYLKLFLTLVLSSITSVAFLNQFYFKRNNTDSFQAFVKQIKNKNDENQATQAITKPNILSMPQKEDAVLYSAPPSYALDGVELIDQETESSGGRVGIGTLLPDSTLHVKGGLKIENGTQGFGKTLTSDEFGGAVWQTPSSIKWNEHVAVNGLTVTFSKPYLSGAIMLYHNGIYIPPTKYSEATSTTITLGFTPSSPNNIYATFGYK